MRDWSQCYRRLGESPREPETLEFWHSPAVADPLWDAFLRSNPCGQFQQSSLWAEFKAAEGWASHRVVATAPSGIVGGFQILWKKGRGGRLGYVSKGPVAHPESAALARRLGALLSGAARELGLTALIAQPPDETAIGAAAYEEGGYILSNPMHIIETTYLIDVGAGMDVLRGRMSGSLRRNLGKAGKKGIVAREGTSEDVPAFFELMAATCRRQNTAPNPSSAESVALLRRIFSPSNSIRMTFAEGAGGTPAAKLCINFGDRVTLWKKGWDGSRGELHPNEFLAYEALEWAQGRGYRLCDFCSLGRPAALRILEGKPLIPECLSSRDEYHLRFGGFPKLLPPSMVYIPNLVLRWGFRNTYARVERLRSSKSPGPMRAAD